jgi:hypothetical protein
MFQARSAYLKDQGLIDLLPSWYALIRDNKSKSNHILNMLSRARGLDATDPRDKIFALLGISSGVSMEDAEVMINYWKPTHRSLY